MNDKKAQPIDNDPESLAGDELEGDGIDFDDDEDA